MFNRVIQTKLPQTVAVSDKQKDATVWMKDDEAKAKMKQYVDQRRRPKDTTIHIGDSVLLRQKKQSKFTTRFDPTPFKVTCMKGTMITAMRNGKYVTRNASLFKKVYLRSYFDEEDIDDYDNGTDQDPNDGDDRNENNSQNNENNGNARRYPIRNRKQLHRYGQNVYES